MKKILYIAPHRPERSPGQRFRFEQYIPWLEQNQYGITYSYILNANDDTRFYQKGNYLYKVYIVLKSFFIRLADIFRSRNHQVVIIYREAWFLGSTFFEWWFSKLRIPVIFDFDDAIWMNDTSEANQNLKWLKKPEKTAKIAKYANLVTVGNQYLADYARQYNSNVLIIPTTIDTKHYVSEMPGHNGIVSIGWIGSYTTIKHFKEAIPELKSIHEKYGNKVKFTVIVDKAPDIEEIPIEHIPWSKEKEVSNLDLMDIGIMPLPDDDWSRGKCGFKGIQCMAMSKPVVMSPVGVNSEIVKHAQNGLLASNHKEWVEALSELIEHEQLRKQLGEAGRKTIVEAYSVDSQKKRLLYAIEQLIEPKNIR